MDGTTLCPHCQTRFKVAEAQLTARNGMVRCGHCLQAFDARPSFARIQSLDVQAEEASSPENQMVVLPSLNQRSPRSRIVSLLAGIASILLLVSLVGQGAYFFRVELAAKYPNLKSTLVHYCLFLRCEVGLPQEPALVSIEASALEPIPHHADQIILNALLRNRAQYSQAFPSLELTLNDGQDKPLARRILLPTDYLPMTESERVGFLNSREVTIKLLLNVHDLKASGYRLTLFYPKST